MAAAATLAKLERWRELYNSFYQDVQPIIVETTETMNDAQDVSASRDFLWKQLHAARGRIASKVQEEEIEGAYVGLYGYRSDAYELFVETLRRLRAEEARIFAALVEATQRIVLSADPRADDYHPTIVGNNLRDVCAKFQWAFNQNVHRELEAMRTFLGEIITASDASVLRTKL